MIEVPDREQGFVRYSVEAMKKAAVCLFLILSPRLLPAATGYLVNNLVADAVQHRYGGFLRSAPDQSVGIH